MIDGFDVDAHARFDLGTYGKLNLGSSATIMNRNAYNGDDGYGFSQNYIGYYGNPKLRANLNLSWQYGDFTSSVFVNYTGGTKWAYDKNDALNNNSQTCKAAGVAVEPTHCSGAPAFKTVNLSLGWTPIKDLRLGMNIKNVLNTKPFYDPYGWEGYNHALNLFGRVVSVSASYKFK